MATDEIELARVQYLLAMYSDGTLCHAEYDDNNVLGPFMPTPDTFFEKTISANNSLSGPFPSTEKILGYSTSGLRYKIAFATEPETVKIYVKGKEKSIKMPKLIWFYTFNQALEIYSINKDEDLLALNMSNVTTSSVCIGTSPHPTSKSFIKTIAEIKEMFYEGEFTHENYQPKFEKTKWKLEQKLKNFLII